MNAATTTTMNPDHTMFNHKSVWSCGHFDHSHIVGFEIQNQRANWITVERETVEDTGTKWCSTATLSSDVCDKCKTDVRFDRNSYHPTGLRQIVPLLQDCLRVIGNRTGVQVQKAREAVDLLDRMAKAYPLNQATRPSRMEMRRYIVFCSTLVGMAIMEVESHAGERRERPRLAFVDGQIYLLEPEGTVREFSPGTVDRQLPGLSTLTHALRGPSIWVKKVTSHMNVPREYHDKENKSTAGLLKARDTVPEMSTVFVEGNISSAATSDKDSEETVRPFAEDDRDSERTVRPFIAEDFEPDNVSEGLRGPLVSEFMAWRDSWTCDICGEDCFCRNLPW